MHFEGSQKRMEVDDPMVITSSSTLFQGMKMRTFQGLLGHKNPKCEECRGHCYALYRGGKKERMGDMFVCKDCNIIYTLSEKKKCEFTEEKPQ